MGQQLSGLFRVHWATVVLGSQVMCGPVLRGVAASCQNLSIDVNRCSSSVQRAAAFLPLVQCCEAALAWLWYGNSTQMRIFVNIELLIWVLVRVCVRNENALA